MASVPTLFSKSSAAPAVKIVYENAETDKSTILLDSKGKAGIYQWTHKESGKIYIGSAADLYKRFTTYYSLLHLRRSDNYIARALLLHKHSSFSLSILEIIDISGLSKENARKVIMEREQYYLDLFFKSEVAMYNILKIAGSPLGYKHTEEALAKMSGENHPLNSEKGPEIRKKLVKV